VGRRKAVEGLFDSGLKFGECRMVSAVEGATFDELPDGEKRDKTGRSGTGPILIRVRRVTATKFG